VQVDIVTAGDQVNELHLIVAGTAVVERLASADPITDSLLLVVEGGRLQNKDRPVLLGPGDTAEEHSFFTELPCLEVRVGGRARVWGFMARMEPQVMPSSHSMKLLWLCGVGEWRDVLSSKDFIAYLRDWSPSSDRP
jgi:hypothetical protein